MKILFMHPFEGTEKIADIRPESFGGVTVDLADAIAIIIPRPFFLTVIDGGMSADDMIVTLILIGIQGAPGLGETMDVSTQRRFSRIEQDPYPNLACFPTDRADNRGTVIGISAASGPFVSPPTRWIRWIEVFVTFFPPRSETSHRFQSVHPGGGW